MSHLESPTSTDDARARAKPAVTWRKVARVVVGLILTLLGLLWTLQGADIIRIEPIGCVAQCEPITGGSFGWFTAGVLALLGGILVLVVRRRRR